MPRPSPIDDLSVAQRAEFEAELIRRNFKDYDGLAEWLRTNGLEISRSSAYRHGSKLQRRLQNVRNSTEAARLIAEAAPDDADLRSAAVISLVQSELFDVMVTLQDLDEAEPGERVGLLKECARSVLDMTKASVLQKKWKQEIELQIKRETLEQAADRISEAAKAQGLDVEQAKFWREKVLMGV
jgi:hypothetical protein